MQTDNNILTNIAILLNKTLIIKIDIKILMRKIHFFFDLFVHSLNSHWLYPLLDDVLSDLL
jgi:hypothetical protein